jgi:hypothetical protein
MTTAGLMVMLFSVALVTLVLSLCVYRVLTAPVETADHLAGAELRTPDMDEGE